MSETNEQDDGVVYHYVGENGCAVASCTSKQEFPDGDSPYCCIHSLQKHMTGEVQPNV